MGIAGLPKPRFATKTSSTTRSTTSATLANATRSSNYSQTKSSAVSFGIRAQRSTVGTGLVFNPGQYNSGYISQQRHAYNDNRVRFYNMPPVQNHKCNGSGGMSTLDKIMAFNALAQNLTGTTAQVINAFKTPQSNQTSGTSGMNGGSSTFTVTESITGMRSATSSLALGNAIQTAKTESDSLPDEIKNAEAELSTLEGNTNQIKSNLKNCANQIKAKTTQISECTATISSCEERIKSLEKIDPNDSNGSIAVLKSQKDEAVKKKEKLEAEIKQLEKDTTRLENELKDNENDIKEKEKQIKELKDKKQSIDQELLTQNKRLEQLKKAEKKTLDSLQSDIDKLITKYKDPKTSDAKKQEIQVQYQAKVNEYNDLLNKSQYRHARKTYDAYSI